MIILVEPVCRDLEHVPVNAGVVQAIRYAYPMVPVVFRGESEHTDRVRHSVTDSVAESVNWEAVTLPGRRDPFHRRIVKDLLLAHDTYVRYGSGVNNVVILLSFRPSVLMAFKVAHALTRNRSTIHAFLHSNARDLVGWRSRNPLLRMQDMTFSVGLFPSRPLRYVVLEYGIKESLSRHRPDLASRLDVFEHPVFSYDQLTMVPVMKTVRFGFIGSAEESKGFRDFVDICRKVKGTTKAEFHCVGHFLVPPITDENLEILDTRPARERLSRDQFLRLLGSIHYVVMPYKLEHYELCASGALLDAITYLKPIIARRIPIFENLERKYGDIGYLCDSTEELKQVVLDLARGPDPDRYAVQQRNLGNARTDRSPKQLSAQIRTILGAQA